MLFHVSFSKENPNKAFLGRYPPANGYPAWYVLSADGRLLWAAENTRESPKWFQKDALKKFLEENAPRATARPVG